MSDEQAQAPTAPDAQVRRKRGRPVGSFGPKRRAEATGTSYQGPSLDTILRLSDEQVLAGYAELGVTPRPFTWHEDDDEWNVALWHDPGLTMTSEEFQRTRPKTPEGMAQLKTASLSGHNAGLRMGLMSAHLHHWVESLDDVQLIAEVERLSDERLSESSRRYLKIADARQQVFQLIWPVVVAASKLYVPPKNPLES